VRALNAVGILALLGGCGFCGSPETVTFRQDTGPRADETPRRRDAGTVAPDVVQGLAFPEATPRVAIEGAPVDAPPGSAIRMLLPADADADGDRDALHLATDPAGAIALRFARRDGPAFGAARDVATIPAPAACRFASATARTLSASHALITIEHLCTPPNQIGNDPLTYGPTHLVVGLEDPPRLRVSIAALDPEGRTPGGLGVDARSVDQDGDGSLDVIVTLSVTPPGATPLARPASVDLAWLDRPGGLARDTQEPEQTIAALAIRASRALARDVRTALADATAAATLHAAICREPGTARFRFDDGEGLPCRPSAGAGRANAVLATALAREHRYLEAMQVFGRLRSPTLIVAARDRTAAEQALTVAAVAARSVREGPAVPPTGDLAPRVHLPALTFFDDTRAVLRAPAGHFVDPETGVATVIDGPAPDWLVRDPGNRYAVVDLRRACHGYVLSIVPAQSVVGGVVAERPVSEPLLESRPRPQGATGTGAACAVPANLRTDDGGWRVLGWAPQGIVAARHEEVRIVPLDANARPAGPPTVLAPRTLPPAPLASGASTPSGSAYVLPTPFGILVRHLGPNPRTTILRVPGEGPITDASISPSATKIAAIRNGRSYFLTLPD
jgi:hypothetical protein